MKKILTAFCLCLMALSAFGQVPKTINYQAVIRGEDGAPLADQQVTVIFRILDMNAGPAVVYEETQERSTNSQGLLNAVIGESQVLEIAWAESQYALEVWINDALVGTSPINSVPYALVAAEVADKDDADADPENELQDLSLDGNILTITNNPGATPIELPTGGGSSQWNLDGDSVTLIDKNVGIGTNSPTGRLVVMGDGTELEDQPLFEVKKSDGQTVFAVYNDGAEVYVNESPTKGAKGGFAVGGYNSGKQFTNEFLRVTADSVRIYVDENPAVKGIKGGFAVGGYNSGKGPTSNYLQLSKQNYFIGHEGGQNVTSGTFNSTIGYQAGAGITSGSENIFLGFMSGFSNTEGHQNTFIGYQAGLNNTTGYQNSFLGYRAGYDNISGHNNLFLGYETGFSNTTGNFNLFLGYRAGAQNTTGQSNMFLGYHSGRVNTIGNRNLFIGPGSGEANVDGNRNIFIGSLSGYNNVSGSSNLFFGEYAGYSNTTGFYNIFIGSATGSSNTTGHRNIIIGDQAGYVNETGYQNTLVGFHSGFTLVDGKENVFVGYESGNSNNGSNNVYIGARAGRSNNGSNNIFIGYTAGTSAITESNTLIIENNSAIAPQDALIYGDLGGTRMVRITGNLELVGTASKSSAGEWTAISDRRVKREISDIKDAFDVMLKLHPVKFRYTDDYLAEFKDVEDRYYYNFVAQEYQEVFPESVQSSGRIIGESNNEILQMDSYNAQIYSIKAVQELILENREQKKQIEELYRMLDELRSKID